MAAEAFPVQNGPKRFKGALESKTPLFSGIIPALFTPFTAAGKLDVDQVQTLVDHHVKHQAGGLYICGSTGEGTAMTCEERRAMTRATCKAAAGRIPVMVMVGGCKLADAVALAKHAGEAGAAAISSVPPGAYSWLGEPPCDLAAAVTFFSEVAAATELPFYPYWLGSLTSGSLTAVEFLRAMKPVPRFAGIKYTSGDLYTFALLREHAPRELGYKLNLLSGCDEVNIAACVMGSDGAIGSTYNVMPKLFSKLRNAFEASDIQAAMRLQEDCNRVIDILLSRCNCASRGTNIVAGLKAVAREVQGMQAAGYARDTHRSEPWTAEAEAALLADINLLEFTVE